MPRPPKPFPRGGWYCTKTGGSLTKLCKVSEGETHAWACLDALLKRIQHQSLGLGAGLLVEKNLTAAHDEFLDEVQARSAPLTYTHYVDCLRALQERYGSRALPSLTPADGSQYQRFLRFEKPWLKGKTPRKGLGVCRVNHHIRAAKTFLRWCARPSRRYLPGNPWDELKLLRGEEGRTRILTEAEFAALLSLEPSLDFREALTVMRWSTLRPGELRILTWDMINWEGHFLALQARNSKGRRYRAVTLLPQAESVLNARLARAKGISGADLVFPCPRRRDGGVRVRGGPWKANAFSAHFRKLWARCAEAGLVQRERDGERIVPYSARHSRATAMVLEGVPLPVIQSDMGHAQISTTQKYLHLNNQQVVQAVRGKSVEGPGPFLPFPFIG